MNRLVAAGALALASSLPIVAIASIPRTFVSVAGSDAQPCTSALPCRSFAAAIAQTNTGGEVIVLDSGGYGAVTITKSVAIVSPPGVYAGISVFSGAGVTIAAGASDAVTLRGLVITAQGGTRGVAFTSGGRLVVDACTISGAFAQGIYVNGPATPLVAVKATHVIESATGIDVGGSGAVLTRLTVTESSFTHVGTGIHLSAGAEVAIERSRLIGSPGNAANGIDIAAAATQNPIRVQVAGSLVRGFAAGTSVVGTATSGRASIVASDLSNNALAVSVNGGRVALADDRVVHSAQMLHATGGGIVNTSGTNYSAFNASAGDAPAAPSGSL